MSKYIKMLLGAMLHDVDEILDKCKIPNKPMRVDDIVDDSELLNYIHFKKISDGSPEFLILNAANYIANGGKESETKQKDLNLCSVFNVINGKSKEKYFYDLKPLNEMPNYPKPASEIENDNNFYDQVWTEILNSMKSCEDNSKIMNQLIPLLEKTLSFVPASENIQQTNDVSLYDHLKMTAALTACIYQYIDHNSSAAYKLQSDLSEFMDEKAFLMFSCDFSGIQKFIYNIKSEKALKSLRSRSFYLEIFLENMIDELLAATQLYRTNLIYTGGGHAYILLPNTDSVKELVDEYFTHINKWLIENYDINLYLAYALCECSGNDLCNIPNKNEPYKEIFRQLSRQLSDKKVRRYSPEEIQILNQHRGNSERECSICGRYENLTETESGIRVCKNCKAFADISGDILTKKYIAVSEVSPNHKAFFEMPAVNGLNYLYMADTADLKNAKRTYVKNDLNSEYGETVLFVGDYVNKDLPELEALAKESVGIDRIGVMRADVDNLGNTFVNGLKYDGENYENLSRTAAFSRQLSLFFKYHINAILSGKAMDEQFSLTNEKAITKKNVVIVYSGGDDVFLIGSWNDVMEVAVDIQRSFKKFTMGKLTISAGIGLFGAKYPVYKAAYDTGDLEELSKQVDEKNAVSLFGASDTENHTYKWDVFTSKIIQEKLSAIEEYFGLVEAAAMKKDEQSEFEKRGMAFVYRMLELLREADKKINIARFAYMLSRLTPPKENVTYDAFNVFSNKMYEWAIKPEDRKELLTALYIFVYLKRKKVNN